MKNQQQMMKQLQQVQARMAKMQEELNDVTVTGTAGGGVVSITADGHRDISQPPSSPTRSKRVWSCCPTWFSPPAMRPGQVARGRGGQHVAVDRRPWSSSRPALTRAGGA